MYDKINKEINFFIIFAKDINLNVRNKINLSSRINLSPQTVERIPGQSPLAHVAGKPKLSYLSAQIVKYKSLP